MHLAEYLSEPTNAHSEQGNLVVTCTGLDRSEGGFNCYLTPLQAISLAQDLFRKAKLIIDEKIDDALVHVWNKGKANRKLCCGLDAAQKDVAGPAEKPNAKNPRTTRSGRSGLGVPEGRNFMLREK